MRVPIQTRSQFKRKILLGNGFDIFLTLTFSLVFLSIGSRIFISLFQSIQSHNQLDKLSAFEYSAWPIGGMLLFFIGIYFIKNSLNESKIHTIQSSLTPSTKWNLLKKTLGSEASIVVQGQNYLEAVFSTSKYELSKGGIVSILIDDNAFIYNIQRRRSMHNGLLDFGKVKRLNSYFERRLKSQIAECIG